MFEIENPVDHAVHALNATMFRARLRAADAHYDDPGSLRDAEQTITELAWKFDELVTAIAKMVGATNADWDFAPERAADDFCSQLRTRIRELEDERCAHRRELARHNIRIEDAP
jgi:hypothetical protein